jgi:phage terminase small subunit
VSKAQNIPRPPSGLGKAGRTLWRAVLEDYVLEEHERALLVEACRTADVCADLSALVAAEGLMSETSQGRRVHPAVVELRQQRLALARLFAALRVPLGDEEAGTSTGRRQRRSGVRGVYGLGGVS